jgi:hypothetical protein
MITEAQIKAVLDADSGAGGIATLLTGGIYARTVLKRGGISERNAPGAYDGPTLKPCLLIVDRSETPDNQINDGGAQVRSMNQVFAFFFYEDGDSTRSAIDAAEARLYVLLESNAIDTQPLLYGGSIKTREEEMNNAHLVRALYSVHGVR